MNKFILIDFNQIVHSSVAHIEKHEKEEGITMNTVRRTLLEGIRRITSRFGNKNVFIINDSDSWRKVYYKHYKYKRKKDREKSSTDYEKIFRYVNAFNKEIKEYFKYNIIQISKCEGDDIISIISKNFNEDNEIIIVARDKDFFQLHKQKNISQFDPVSQKFIKKDIREINFNLFEHICKGDSSDGIPNIKEKDDFFVEKILKNSSKRQESIYKGELQLWYGYSEEELKENFDERMYKRFRQNRILIDLSKIPSKVENYALNKINQEIKREKNHKVLEYFMKYDLKEFLENLGDF